MSSIINKTVQEFKINAEAVSSEVFLLGSWEDIYAHIEELISKTKTGNIAVTGFPVKISEKLADIGSRKKIKFYHSGLRNNSKIDIGINMANFGIAETGSLVIQSGSEDVRLTGMLAEEHVVIVNSSDIKESADDITDSLKNNFNKAGKYTAFITGPSRTADIERVLSIGVHGPVRLRILILEDKNGL